MEALDSPATKGRPQAHRLISPMTWLRTPLVLAVSNDASHWRNFLTLENAPGEFSYPALIQARSGALLITYTWDRKRIRFVKVDLAQVP